MGAWSTYSEYFATMSRLWAEQDARLTAEYGPAVNPPLPTLPALLPRGPSEYGNAAHG
jgi:hypothetical protein